MVALTYHAHCEKLRDVGREVPAGKYSPALELHPMYRAAVTAKDASFAASGTPHPPDSRRARLVGSLSQPYALRKLPTNQDAPGAGVR